MTPVSSLIGGSASGSLTQKDTSGGPQFSGLIPHTGGTYQVGLSARRVVTDNNFVTLNPQFPTALTFNLTQPLWRGLRIDQNRSRIEIARKNQQITDDQFRQRVIEVAAQAERAYWDLVFAARNLDVQMEGVDSARQQVGSNRRMAEQGILAPIDVVEAETQLATLEQNLYAAQEALTRAENALKSLILPDRSSILWATAWIPEEPPVADVKIEPLADVVNEALANRPELAQIRATAEINEINTRLSRDQLKPQVDFVAVYTSSGLAGTQLPAGPNPLTAGTDALIGRLNDSLGPARLASPSAAFHRWWRRRPAVACRRRRAVVLQSRRFQLPHRARRSAVLAAASQSGGGGEPGDSHRRNAPHGQPARPVGIADRSRRAKFPTGSGIVKGSVERRHRGEPPGRRAVPQ